VPDNSELDYYKVLQVDPHAEQEVIDAAYRRLARKYHPDVYKGPDHDKRMRDFNLAYEVLGDPGKRLAYDAMRSRQSTAQKDTSSRSDYQRGQANQETANTHKQSEYTQGKTSQETGQRSQQKASAGDRSAGSQTANFSHRESPRPERSGKKSTPAPRPTGNKTRRLLLIGVAGLMIVALASGIVWFTVHQASTGGGITEFPLPTASSAPSGITAGPDGNLWFTEDGGEIGRISRSGTITEFPPPIASSAPSGITAGPDGNLWFTEDVGKIGRITPRGTITEFPLPTVNRGYFSYAITAGPDGNLWFTEDGGNKIGRITPRGTVAEFAIPTPQSGPRGITAGPDGNLWFTEDVGSKIGRITPRGTITEFPLPTFNSDNNTFNFSPVGIAAGPDGNLWFTEGDDNWIGRITPRGTVAEFAIPTPRSNPWGITAGPDGNLWFTEDYNSGKIGRISPSSK